MHYILSFSYEEYGRLTSLGNISASWRGPNADSPSLLVDIPTTHFSPYYNSSAVHGKRANAVLVILARNSDTDNTVRSIREIEERFNKQFNYPYVLLNEVEFTKEFKECVFVLDWVWH